MGVCLCTSSQDRLLSWVHLHRPTLLSLVSDEFELVLVLPRTQRKGNDGHGLVVINGDREFELALPKGVVLAQITSRDEKKKWQVT